MQLRIIKLRFLVVVAITYLQVLQDFRVWHIPSQFAIYVLGLSAYLIVNSGIEGSLIFYHNHYVFCRGCLVIEVISLT